MKSSPLQTKRSALIFFQLFVLLGGLTSCALFRPAPVKLFQHAKAKEPLDAVIVPGVPITRDGTWDSIMKARVLWSVYLFKHGMTKNIIFSGNAVYSPYVEAKAMALYASALGVPEEHILVEPLALHSTENVYFSYKIAKEKGFKTLGLATDPFQASLLYRFTKKRFRTPIIHIPILFDTIRKLNAANPIINIIPAHVDNWKSIVETQSPRFRRRGTRGKNIPFTKRKMDAL
jgi:uncharacterized SAM-binding protein YcdF (DUF218 family)